MYILGISSYYHDSAACLVKDGEIVAAAQEERFTRVKHDASFPLNAVKFCLDQVGIGINEVDFVGYYEKPHLKFERILSMYATHFPKGFNTFKEAIPAWLTTKFKLPEVIVSQLLQLSETKGQPRWMNNLLFCEHHMSHAASAFYPSPFEEAAILTIDGVGEWATTCLAKGSQTQQNIPEITFLSEVRYPHSLGMLYSAFTYFLGFKVNSGEYKVMGLAPYGEPVFKDLILEHLIDLKEDGSFQLNMKYFTFPFDFVMISKEFPKLFGMERRSPESKLEQTHFDIAASIQKVIEEIVVKIANYLYKVTRLEKLCLAGGVALNCVANGRILDNTPFSDIWVQPAAGDAGGSLGVALHIWHQVLKKRRIKPKDKCLDLMKGALLGPSFNKEQIQQILRERGIKYSFYENRNELLSFVAESIKNNKVVGWFQGKMEFGPRALGARSILGNPQSDEMQRTMNLKIKFRESFRPFAPSVMREYVQDWFEIRGKENSLLGSPADGYDSPYMLLVAPVRQDKTKKMTPEEENLFGIEKLNVSRSEIPACTHVDYSARVQTVTVDTNSVYYQLLKCFYEKTGIPILINTSFNVRGEPIVCTPEDAVNCFLGTHIDILVMENIVVNKLDIENEKLISYKDRFKLD